MRVHDEPGQTPLWMMLAGVFLSGMVCMGLLLAALTALQRLLFFAD